jgi:hypothetical protein
MENHRALEAVFRLGFALSVCMLTLAPNSVQSQQNVPGAPAVKDPIRGSTREATARSATA